MTADFVNVAARGMLAYLHISTWAAQRFDADTSDEVNAQKGAERHSSRVNKHLFGTRRAGRALAPEFFAAIDAADRLRATHDRLTLPWGRMSGERLLPTRAWEEYTDAIRQAGRDFRRAVDVLVDAYPRLQREAEARLGQLYSIDDFIPAADVRRRFAYTVEFGPVPSSGDIRCDLPADTLADIEAQVQARVERLAREAQQDAWRRLYEAVARVQKATLEGGVVRSTLVEHVQRITGDLSLLNVGDDEQLEAFRRRVEADFSGLAVEDLRSDDRLRADAQQRAADIMAAMRDFYAPPAPAAAA